MEWLDLTRCAGTQNWLSTVSGELEKRTKVGKQYGLKHLCSSEEYDHALSEVDASGPNHMHREYAMRTAQAQVNVLCKKPGAVTEEGRTGAKQTSARLYLITGILRRTEPYLSSRSPSRAAGWARDCLRPTRNSTRTSAHSWRTRKTRRNHR
jgi:hypothetical protein